MFQRIETLEKEKKQKEEEFKIWKRAYTHNVADCPIKVCIVKPTVP